MINILGKNNVRVNFKKADSKKYEVREKDTTYKHGMIWIKKGSNYPLWKYLLPFIKVVP